MKNANPSPIEVLGMAFSMFYIAYASTEMRIHDKHDHCCYFPVDNWTEYKSYDVVTRIMIELFFFAYCLFRASRALLVFAIQDFAANDVVDWSIEIGLFVIGLFVLYYRRHDRWVQWLFTPMGGQRPTMRLANLVIKDD